MGLLALLALIYLGGAAVNPTFFGSPEAFHALLRDTSRVAIIAVGMTYVIINKDLDLSVGSIYGLVAVVFARLFAPSFADLDIVTSVVVCVLLGMAIGLVNGVLVTILKVPAFIATLTTLLIGRGFVLALTHGQAIYYPGKAKEAPLFFHLGETNVFGFNNQIAICAVVAVIGAYVLANTRWGYETFATGGNEQAAVYAGIPTNWVRIRAYLLSSLCATVAGLLSAAQDKGVTPLYGVSGELTVIAAVIIGGASILGGRGRVAGSCLGATLVVLLNKVLREGLPITRTIKIGEEEVTVNAVYSLPVGAVPVFLGLLLVIAVLIEPYLIRRQVAARLWAWLRGRPPPPAFEIGGVALEGVVTKGAMATDIALSATGFGKFLARRDALAVILTVVLWLTGLFLRPDYWWNLSNTFAILLNYTELALITVGLTYVIAAGDIDLSVGAVLALAGSAAAYFLKVLGADPVTAVAMGLLAGMLAGLVNAVVAVGLKLPAFIATLGMFYIARGLAAWFVAGQQLTGWPEGYKFARPQGERRPPSLRHRASGRHPQNTGRGGQRADDLDDLCRRDCRHRARLHAVRAKGLCNRRQHARRRLCRHQHQSSALHLAHAGGVLRDDGRDHQRRLFPKLQPRCRPVPRTRRHRVGDHRRRVDLQRLRHHAGFSGRCSRDHSR